MQAYPRCPYVRYRGVRHPARLPLAFHEPSTGRRLRRVTPRGSSRGGGAVLRQGGHGRLSVGKHGFEVWAIPWAFKKRPGFLARISLAWNTSAPLECEIPPRSGSPSTACGGRGWGMGVDDLMRADPRPTPPSRCSVLSKSALTGQEVLSCGAAISIESPGGLWLRSFWRSAPHPSRAAARRRQQT